MHFLKEGNRLPKPRHCDEKLYQTMMQCWAPDKKDRPRFTDLVKFFDEHHRNVTRNRSRIWVSLFRILNLSNQLFSRIKWKAIYSMMYQIHQLVWRWSPVMRIIHTKLKSQFPQKENHLKTWQKMSFNKTLQLTQIIMIRRNIWALRDHQITTRVRHLIMDHSATYYRIMDRKETCIMEIREIPQVYIKLIQWNRQPFLKVRFKFSCGIRFNGIFRYKPR